MAQEKTRYNMLKLKIVNARQRNADCFKLSKEKVVSPTLSTGVCLPYNSCPHGGVGRPFLLHRLLQTPVDEPQCPGKVTTERQ